MLQLNRHQTLRIGGRQVTPQGIEQDARQAQGREPSGGVHQTPPGSQAWREAPSTDSCSLVRNTKN